MRVAILGFGLIGGSIALALREASSRTPEDFRVSAWSPSGLGPSRARAEGVVDDAPRRIEDAVADAEVVLLAAPPLACLELLGRLGGPLRRSLDARTTITDVASTKAAILQLADDLELPFVGGHPMAGREIAGYDGAQYDLFADRPWVVVPGRHARADDVARVERLAKVCGARPLRLTAQEHDRAVAGISHLPLVLSAALVEAVFGRNGGTAGASQVRLERQLAAGGWRDMTRLARGDVDMGAGIAVTNAGPLAERLRDVRDVIDAWLADLARINGTGDPDAVPLAARLQAAKDRLEGS
jgi:prephenate dehydrogenase